MLGQTLDHQNLENKFYYPICNKIGCDGLLNIKINEYNFTIDFDCEKSKSHKRKGLTFKTFENFFLEEKTNLKCSKCCSNIDNSDIYKCKKCNSFHCLMCFILDEHIKNDISNLILNSNKCNSCHKDLIKYCVDCGKKICLYCIKNDIKDNVHANHKIEYIMESIPSNKEIDDINDKITGKKKYIEELINSIDLWHQALLKKVDKLKQDLKNEMIFIEKFFSNFNPHFVNFIYYKNFNDFNSDVCIKKNKFLKNFKESLEFEEQTKHIFEALFYNKAKVKEKNGVLKYDCYFENGMVSQLDEENFMIYYDKSKYFEINCYNNTEKAIFYYPKTRIDLYPSDKIYSISFSKVKKKVYVCFDVKKIVRIYDYIDNVDNNKSIKELKACSGEIKDSNNLRGHYNKCIYLVGDYVATADEEKVGIWHENMNDIANYSNITNIELNAGIGDLLLVNDDCFCSAQSSLCAITFFDTNNFNNEKVLMNIKCVKGYDCLFLIKEYIIVNCTNGISIISSATKELIQTIQNFYENQNKKICVGNEKIYILEYNYNILIKKMKLINGSFIETKQYKILQKVNVKNDDSLKDIIACYNSNKLGILYTNSCIIIFGKNLYCLKEVD